jgi:cold-inducible RNA-binding protein
MPRQTPGISVTDVIPQRFAVRGPAWYLGRASSEQFLALGSFLSPSQGPGQVVSPATDAKAQQSVAQFPKRERDTMGNRLYVGNLAFQTTEAEVQNAFSQVGTVTEVKLVLDRDTGRSRGFAFVSMGSDEEARRAIAEMNGRNLDGRDLRVNEAEERQRGGGGGGGGGYGRR